MSRIQDILTKAEREGTARRTRSLTEDYNRRERPEEPRTARQPSELPPALPPRLARGSEADARARSLEPSAPSSEAIPLPAPSAHAPHRTRGAAVEVPITDATGRSAPALDPRLVAALAPSSLAAEQYRSLRTRLKRAESGRSLRTIAITSPAKGDGKSLTAANLALTMAQEVQQRVLLVDCDLRRPNVHRLFGLDPTPGLVDVLMNAATLDQVLVWLPEQQMSVLPAGIPPSNPAELLGSATMRRLLDTLRSRYDRILVDVPPVAPLADLHVLAPLVDGLLMIIRAGMTQKPAIDRALAGLDPSKVLGLVLNEANGDAADAPYGYGGYGYLAG